MDSDDLIPRNFTDPFDRLEEIEIVQMGQGMAMMNMSEQLKNQADLGVDASKGMLELVRHIDILVSKIAELEYRIEQLEH
jgi:hypothetical protein